MNASKISSLDEKAVVLWKQWFHSSDRSVRHHIFQHYAPLVRLISSKYFRKNVSPSVEYSDYLHYGSMGLLQAIDQFDPKRDVKFTTYASSRIRGAILDGITHFSEINEQYVFRRRYREERLQSLKASKKNKTFNERFQNMIDVTVGLAIGLLLENTAMYQSDEDVKSSPSPYQSQEYHSLSKTFVSLISQLSNVQKTIIDCHYFSKMSFSDIAEHLGVTRSRVSQVHKEAIETLKNLYHAAKIDLLA